MIPMADQIHTVRHELFDLYAVRNEALFISQYVLALTGRERPVLRRRADMPPCG